MIDVHLIPAFDDNYFFCVSNEQSAVIVDPGSAKEVLSFIEKNNLKLTHILATHHHADHIGGIEELRKYTGAQVIGPFDLSKYGIKVDTNCKQGDTVDLDFLKFSVLEVPGHTLDHLAYYSAEQDWLFCGDTIFSLGCGRLFEGTFEQMFNTLKTLKALPDSTKIYCAHEYTLTNLKFSLSYLQANNASERLLNMYADLQQKIIFLRAQGTPTIPTTLGFEKQFNLLLKAESLIDFKKVREARNNF